MARIAITNLTVIKIDNFCLSGGYQDLVPNPAAPGTTMPNPETKLQYMERRLRAYAEGEIARGKILARQATRAAEDAADVTASALPVGEITP